MTSDTSRRAAALVEERLPQARRLGASLAEVLGEPDAFAITARAGMAALADPEYAAAQERIAPGSGVTIGVRWPLIHAVERELQTSIRESPSDVILWLAQRLTTEPAREVRSLALPCLARTLRIDPERTWQLLRRLARAANDWISVDTVAEVYAQGVLAEGFRWAELEQLVYSDQRMERRLVGSTLARIPHQVPRRSRAGLRTNLALELVEQLMGDPDDQVQKALAWAIREWSRVDSTAVREWIVRQSVLAAATDDGHRAWVIRDTLSILPAADATAIRARLTGVRKRRGAPSTSRATSIARQFGLQALTDRAIAQQGERFTGRGS